MDGKNLNDTTVIILAGGKGIRANLKIPKQFAELNGKRVIEHSIDRFLGILKNVIVVVPDIVNWKKGNFMQPIKLVIGGQTRTDSLLAGLSEVETKYTLIHDASRPIVPERVVYEVISALGEYECAYPVLGVKNSLVIDVKEKLQATPNRNLFKEIQTPQGFHTATLRKALTEFGDRHVHIPELVRWLGKDVKHVLGSPWLFKITYEPDLYAAKCYLAEKRDGFSADQSRGDL